MLDRERYWRSLAFQRLRDLSSSQLAFSAMEAEAKISESQVFGSAKPQPHVVQIARSRLVRSGELVEVTERGRGGRLVKLYSVAETKGRAKAVDAALKRKRLLMNRYYGWAQGTDSYEGITGPAAEIVSHTTIIRSGIGTLLSNPTSQTGNVDTFLGRPVPIGPLDNGFLFIPLDTDGNLRLSTSVAVPVEVKNLREWIYPSTRELFQLLTKAALLQRDLHETPLVPLLICRRAHTTTHRMAKAMGFFVIQARQQFIQEHSRATKEAINEVRSELGLFDLVVASDTSVHILSGLQAMRTKYDIVMSSTRWRTVSENSTIVNLFRDLAKDMSTRRRSFAMSELRAAADYIGLGAGW